MTTTENIISPLDWDTIQLGIKTARINTLDEDLSKAISLAKSQKVQLLYWQTPQSDKYIQFAEKHKGILADHKITYLINLTDLHPDQLISEINHPIKTYADNTPSPELTTLAFESGKYSRFRADPHMTESQFQAVYKEWIKNSVNHSIASDVLVINNNNHLLGFVTLGEKNQRGDIGLLAVSENARGKNVGTSLVKSSQQYFIQHKYTHSQVVTQQANIPACKLYEKCGYHIEKIELFFHFWI
jgi:dTDP-4-amino-4,6-dideoxy-D-galactose acyltransferase